MTRDLTLQELKIPENRTESSDDEITLGVLSTVYADANVSQRHMARELGVALGLTNAYLKRCIRKGFVKVQQVPRRRYAYYLTPQGFAEKARLTGEYLSSSLKFFRQARQQISSLMQTCANNGWQRVALIGLSELAEIATLCAHDAAIDLVCVADANSERAQFCGLPVVARLEDLLAIDAVIITAMSNPDAAIAIHCAGIPTERILAPRVLRLAPVQPRELEENVS